MCLILTTLAAVVSTAVWYASAKMRGMKIAVLSWLFWGAAIMWFVDLSFEYAEEGADVFNPSYKVAVAVKTVDEDEAPGQDAEAAGNGESAASEAESAPEGGNAAPEPEPTATAVPGDGNSFSLSVEPSGEGEVAFVLSGPDASVPGQPLNLVVKPSEKGVAIELAHVDGILNDTVLGLAVITLALVIWIVVLLVSDPQGVMRAALLKKKKA